MKRRRGGRFWGAVACALLLLVAVAIWQWETLARWAIVTTVERMADVRLTLGPMTLRTDRAVFENVRVTSLLDEPIATIARLSIAYNLRDLLPSGKRRWPDRHRSRDAASDDHPASRRELQHSRAASHGSPSQEPTAVDS